MFVIETEDSDLITSRVESKGYMIGFHNVLA